MISNPPKSDQLIAAISLLESSVILLRRFAAADAQEIVTLQADLLSIVDACVRSQNDLSRKVKKKQLKRFVDIDFQVRYNNWQAPVSVYFISKRQWCKPHYDLSIRFSLRSLSAQR